MEDNLSDGKYCRWRSCIDSLRKLYVDMTPKERDRNHSRLLKYCELDTLAMVMIYEHFKHDIINNFAIYEILVLYLPLMAIHAQLKYV
jgi:hypothetical protein